MATERLNRDRNGVHVSADNHRLAGEGSLILKLAVIFTDW